jgi:hypothetical protein
VSQPIFRLFALVAFHSHALYFPSPPPNSLSNHSLIYFLPHDATCMEVCVLQKHIDSNSKNPYNRPLDPSNRSNSFSHQTFRFPSNCEYPFEHQGFRLSAIQTPVCIVICTHNCSDPIPSFSDQINRNFGSNSHKMSQKYLIIEELLRLVFSSCGFLSVHPSIQTLRKRFD